MKVISTLRVLQLMIMGLILVAVHLASAQSVSNSKDIIVRPCTPDEFKVSESAEFLAHFKDEKPKFQWCESVEVPWLPDARLLRFHTAIMTDYTRITTVVIANKNANMLFADFGEGMMGHPASQIPQRNAIAQSLMESANPKLQRNDLFTASYLFLFLTGQDRSYAFFSKRMKCHPLLPLKNEWSEKNEGKYKTIEIKQQFGLTKIFFSRHNDDWRFDGFNERIVYLDDELKIDEKHPYPNQLPGYEYYEKFLTPLLPEKSSLKDAEDKLGSDSSRAHDGWHITTYSTCTESYKICEQIPKAQQKVYQFEFVPTMTISFAGINFPDKFAIGGGFASGSDIDGSIKFNVYTDDYGLEYWLHASNSKYGKKGDLFKIVYKAIEK
jgi:hypothetical protein